MKYTKYLAYVGEAKNYESPTALLAEYGYPGDCPLSADNLIKAFEIIYAVANDDFAAIVGDNLVAFARKFSIPRRSMQNWKLGATKPPEYILQMIGYILIAELIDASAKRKIFEGLF